MSKTTDDTGEIGDSLQEPVYSVAGEEKFLYTESEPWKNSKLALINAVLDTILPGARLVLNVRKNGGEVSSCFLSYFNFEQRPRDIANSLRTLADSVEALRSDHPPEKSEDCKG